jgi:metallo-beta-lactamase class B
MRQILFLLAWATLAFSQKSDQSDWSKPFPPHRVIGPVYYVGTADLACFLITSPEGHILINTGLADSGPLIRKNIESLGFKPSDIRILLTNQAHFDHVAALAEMKKLTGANIMATEGDKAVLEDGGRSDFLLKKNYWFEPVKVDTVITDGMLIKTKGIALRAHLTPGHTKGSVSYSMLVRENGRDYNVMFSNLATMIGAKLVGNEKYPSIASDYSKTFRLQRALACDIFLAAHGSQYRMREKYKSQYSPDTFVDPEGYKRAVAECQDKFEKQLRQEQAEVR